MGRQCSDEEDAQRALWRMEYEKLVSEYIVDQHMRELWDILCAEDDSLHYSVTVEYDRQSFYDAHSRLI